MNCSQCSEAIEPGALFCGNCGQPLQAANSSTPATSPKTVSTEPVAAVPPSPVARVLSNATDAVSPQPAPSQTGGPVLASNASGLPGYAVVNPVQHKAETKAMFALVAGVLSLPGSIIPFLGITLAVTALVLSTIARGNMQKKLMSTLAIIFAVLGILASIGMFIYAVQYEANNVNSSLGSSSSNESTVPGTAAVSGSKLDTPCYSVSMIPALKNITNAAGSCSAQAFNDDTLNNSSNALAIEAVKQAKANENNFPDVAKNFVDNYIADSLPDYVVTSRKVGTFAKSASYTVNAKKNGQNTTIQLALVYHPVVNGESLYILAHAIDEGQANLSDFESTWVWK
jgi:hypothetical protein